MVCILRISFQAGNMSNQLFSYRGRWSIFVVSSTYLPNKLNNLDNLFVETHFPFFYERVKFWRR